MNKNVSKDQFVSILRDAGISEAQMKKLHELFETRHPEQHASFLAHLGIDASESARIRKAVQTA